MESNDLDFFRIMLQKELVALLAKADADAGELAGDAYGANEADPLDRASEEQSRSHRLHIRSRESRLIAKIEKCLRAIDEGTYGICEDCEEPIGLARLKARPVTSLCIACKTKQEALERITGT
jgi:DnaK suppressor protein